VTPALSPAATVANMTDRLTSLEAGAPVLYGGDKVTYITGELAAAFQPGDKLIVVQSTGDLLHVPAADHETANVAVAAAARAFESMGAVSDDQISAFYRSFADLLADDQVFAPIAAANASDVKAARARGRSATRLVLSEQMRRDMISGLQIWEKSSSSRAIGSRNRRFHL